MKKFVLPLMAMLVAGIVQAQNIFTATVKDSLTNELLIGSTAVIKGTTIGASADANGKVEIKNIADGNTTIVFSFIGYQSLERVFTFPITEVSKETFVYLTPEAAEIEEVVVSSTRTSRTIENEPTRVETIEAEEIDEKNNMRPANVSMLLQESTGMQVQQTSATSGNAGIRIQGLDGRYTQLLKDGYPNFSNFSSGLSLLEIPPLDLKQVEIIKGPASTLYGAGAIAGVVNFISKTPSEKGEYNFIVNQSHVGQTNVGAFVSKRKNKTGFTLLALGNNQLPYDADKDDFTELPKATDFTIAPKLFFYPTEKAMLMFGNSFTQGERTGGDIQYIKGNADTNHTYFEKNNSIRNTSVVEFNKFFKEKNHLTIRSSFTYFEREINVPGYYFKGINNNSFSDISYVHNFKKHTLIVGGNFIYDDFIEKQIVLFPLRNFTTTTGGLYIQHAWDVAKKFQLESGVRCDAANYFNSNYNNSEVVVLPRVSALFKITDKLTSRIGGGLGYKTPTLFTEQTESFQYQKVLPLNKVTSEQSAGGTADVSFKTGIGKNFYFALNEMFFYTQINNSTVLQTDTSGNYYFSNTSKWVQSLGFETNAKLIFKENFKLFVGYTYTDARAEYLTGNQFLPLLPRNKLNLAVVYEKENDLKIGLEGYFTDQQYLSSGLQTPAFWEFGFMAEKTFGKISVFVNFENFTNQRQSNYKTVVNEPHNNPTFDEIWMHTEGFVFNGGIKIKL